MQIGDFVLVTKHDSELYRRRCKIIEVTAAGQYVVYSEGLEQQDTVNDTDIEKSKF